MICHVYLAPKFDGVAITRPVYRIENDYYDITTLKSSRYSNWEAEALFRIPIDLDRDWITTPIFVETACGGVVIETSDDGRFALGIPSTKRALESPVLRLYKMLLPNPGSFKEEKGLVARVLLEPDPVACEILGGLARFGLTLNEYFGRSEVREGGSKIEFKTVAKMLDQRHIRRINWIPEFKEPERYRESNVIILVTDTSSRISGTIGSLLHQEGKYVESLAMIVAKL